MISEIANTLLGILYKSVCNRLTNSIFVMSRLRSISLRYLLTENTYGSCSQSSILLWNKHFSIFPMNSFSSAFQKFPNATPMLPPSWTLNIIDSIWDNWFGISWIELTIEFEKVLGPMVVNWSIKSISDLPCRLIIFGLVKSSLRDSFSIVCVSWMHFTQSDSSVQFTSLPASTSQNNSILRLFRSNVLSLVVNSVNTLWVV